eukprot:15434865-Alexandrium_andersonii.AAC.1
MQTHSLALRHEVRALRPPPPPAHVLELMRLSVLTGPPRASWVAGLPTLPPAHARAEHALEDRERCLQLPGVGVCVGRFGLEGPASTLAGMSEDAA